MTQPQPIKDLDAIDPRLLLQPTPFIQASAPEVIAFARMTIGDAATDVERGIRLFYAVRDKILYDPYRLPEDEEGYQARTVLREKRAFCIPKSNLLAAVARAVGIPAAVGFADVVNHLVTEKLRKAMGGKDLFIYHGYTMLKLGGKWFKVTPAFNLSLCEKFGVLPLDFDGKSDALLHPFDAHNNRHMEYVRERGVFSEFPYQEIRDAFQAYYPDWGKSKEELENAEFSEEKPIEP